MRTIQSILRDTDPRATPIAVQAAMQGLGEVSAVVERLMATARGDGDWIAIEWALMGSDPQRLGARANALLVGVGWPCPDVDTRAGTPEGNVRVWVATLDQATAEIEGLRRRQMLDRTGRRPSTAVEVSMILPRVVAETNVDVTEALGELDRMADLVRDLRKAAHEAGENADWPAIDRAIFPALRRRAEAAMRIAGSPFPDYADPDATHEENARAWMAAFDAGHDACRAKADRR